MKNLKHISRCLLFLTFVSLASCNKFLDIKPDTSQSVPETLFDFRRLLNDESMMNFIFGAAGEIATDNLYISDKDFIALTNETDRNLYIWEDNVFNNFKLNAWNHPYISIFTSNVILEGLDKVKPNSSEVQEWEEIKGSALFFRAYAFYDLSTFFGQPYDSNTAEKDLGIVLRLNSDLNEESVRSSVSECYNQIVNDLEKSIDLLPESSTVLLRPSKLASFGLLARVYLDMDDYEKAERYANKFLEVNSYIMDFNSLDYNRAYPIPQYNSEVSFFSSLSSYYILNNAHARISSELYDSFEENDLRKIIYAKEANDGKHYFRGSYDGSSRFFNGFSTNEMILIRAECRARNSKLSEALEDLNYLLVNRYKKGTYASFESIDQNEVLMKVLEERRKELMFRGLRWADLRRLNKDPKTAVSINRILEDTILTLPPKSLKYTLLIPEEIIRSTNIEQNKR